MSDRPTYADLADMRDRALIAEKKNEQLERELAEAVRERDDLRIVMERNQPGMDRAQEMLDGGRWAGFPLIEGVTAELAEAREQLEDFEIEATNAINDIVRVKYQRDTLAEALTELLDALGATHKPHELIGYGIAEHRAQEIVALAAVKRGGHE